MSLGKGMGGEERRGERKVMEGRGGEEESKMNINDFQSMDQK